MAVAEIIRLHGVAACRDTDTLALGGAGPDLEAAGGPP